jgi:hypothetical protein
MCILYEILLCSLEKNKLYPYLIIMEDDLDGFGSCFFFSIWESFHVKWIDVAIYWFATANFISEILIIGLDIGSLNVCLSAYVFPPYMLLHMVFSDTSNTIRKLVHRVVEVYYNSNASFQITLKGP